MDLLIVEDCSADREVLRYVLENKYQKEASFREADRLETALRYMSTRTFDCVILDLSLPDSSGRETFEKLYAAHPHTPYIILTNTKDRALALELVRAGASDYIVKDYTNVEALFERIELAATKAKVSIRVPEESVGQVKQLEKAKVALQTAHRSGQHRIAQEASVDATIAIVDLTQKVFAELQRVTTIQAKASGQLDSITDMVQTLDREVLRGHSNRPSMRSQVEIMSNNLQDVTARVKELEGESKEQLERKAEEAAQEAFEAKSEAIRIQKAAYEAEAAKHAKLIEKDIVIRQDRTKLWLGIFGLIGAALTAWFTYLAAHK